MLGQNNQTINLAITFLSYRKIQYDIGQLKMDKVFLAPPLGTAAKLLVFCTTNHHVFFVIKKLGFK
jgi:hypothetical protein